MVTKKEYQSGSETDEEPAAVKPKSTPKKEKVFRFSTKLRKLNCMLQVEIPAPKKPKLASSGNRGQAGIMNFFKKK